MQFHDGQPVYRSLVDRTGESLGLPRLRAGRELQPLKEETKVQDGRSESRETETESPPEEPLWPSLTAEDICSAFKVVGDLTEGTKLNVIDRRSLAVDDSYLSSWSRHSNGQGRELLKGYLMHLLEETKRVFRSILNESRRIYTRVRCNNTAVNDNVSQLRNLHRSLTIFLHRFDTMKRVYQADTKTYAEMGVIRNNFYAFEDSFYRELVLYQSENEDLDTL